MQGTRQEPKKGSAASGLTSKEVLASRAAHGENRITRQRGKSFWGRFASNLGDPVIRILLCALIVKLLLLFQNNDWVETLGIGLAVFLATLISTLSEHGSQKAFARLFSETDVTPFRVRRDGGIRQIPLTEIVVGDVVLLSAGEQIPADGYLLSGEIKSDQSSLTGESTEVSKRAGETRMTPSSTGAIFRGCTVTRGSCELLVTAVGDATSLGEISREIQLEQRESPLKRRLTKLAKQISAFGYLAAVLVSLAYLLNVFLIDSGMNWELIRLKLFDVPYLFSQLLHAFTLGLTVIVVAVPEGLPMMIAVVLSSNIRKMAADQVLVRKPVGIEAAGSMNLLFTDKTGTLTEGRMQVSALIRGDGKENSFAAWQKAGDPCSRLASLCFRYGNDATVGAGADGKPCAIGGSATERALLECVLPYPVPQSVRVSSRLPFDSAKKYSAVTLWERSHLTLILGAPEKLLPLCSASLVGEDKTAPLDRRRIEACYQKHARVGERVLALAISNEGISAERHENGILGSLTLVGLVCISDPLRAQAAESVAALQDAGIGVVMITGDNPETARSIAARSGILCRERDLVLTSAELAQRSDEEVCKLLVHLAVVARALPTDKSRLVRLSQTSGNITGMTGDGINDAPALKRADIGFAMGDGTQVAKDAGDIIILDNNLASIVKAVLYGRNIFKSIRKFITLQLTMNFCAMAVTMICPFLGVDSPITVVQMLWINIIMDTLGGLAFAGEPAHPSCMKEPPKRQDEPILNRYMINQILTLGGFTVGLCIYFLKSPRITSLFRPHEDGLYLLTAFFVLFIFSSVFNCFNARTDRLKLFAGLGKNRAFLLIMGAILVIQILFVYLGGSVLRTAPLLAREMLVTLLLSLSVFPAEILRKALSRLFGKRSGY